MDLTTKTCPFCHGPMHSAGRVKHKLGVILEMARDMINQVLPEGSERWECTDPTCRYFAYFKPPGG